MFELSKSEFETLRCNFSTSNQRGGTRYLPFALTEQVVAMLSAVLKSDKAIDVNIAIMRAFVFIRQYALSHKELTNKLKTFENRHNKKDKIVTEQSNRRRIGYHTKESE